MKYLESSDKDFMVLLETDFDKYFKLNKVSCLITYSSFKLN